MAIPQGYIEKRVPGDGDCFFHCMKEAGQAVITRRNVCQRIQESLGDPTIRNSVELIAEKGIDHFLQDLAKDTTYVPVDLCEASRKYFE